MVREGTVMGEGAGRSIAVVLAPPCDKTSNVVAACTAMAPALARALEDLATKDGVVYCGREGLRLLDVAGPRRGVTVLLADTPGVMTCDTLAVVGLTVASESTDGNSIEVKTALPALLPEGGVRERVGRGVWGSAGEGIVRDFGKECAGHEAELPKVVGVRPYNKRQRIAATAFAGADGGQHGGQHGGLYGGQSWVCCTGELARVLEQCDTILVDDGEGGTFTIPLDDTMRQKVVAEGKRLADINVEVMAFADRTVDENMLEVMRDNEAIFWGACDWTFLGCVGTEDPVREEVAMVVTHLAGLECRVACVGSTTTGTTTAAVVGVEKELRFASSVEEAVLAIKEKFGGQVVVVGSTCSAADFSIVGNNAMIGLRTSADCILKEGNLEGVVALVKLLREGGHEVVVPEPVVTQVVAQVAAPPKVVKRQESVVETREEARVEQVGKGGCGCVVS